ncbi:segregation/condensation protein A [uncultured Streptococcus sp.]|uniref:segregation/condensation protein A n=1 Tax=uncultured Streptococcus sp. TaxID=83427 RepID=UPI002666A3BC|nr:segregation/condensation protein A [uncultured Streptococcus sp.]
MDIKLKDFEGPLDLLLHLVSKYQMDIYDVPIVEVIEQYLTYISTLQAMKLEVAGEYMVMASQLMLIKSRKLLPKIVETEPEEDDPEQELLAQIEEYRRFKAISEEMSAQHDERAKFYSKPKQELIFEDAVLAHDKTIMDLFLSFSHVMAEKRRELKNSHTVVERDDYRIEDMMTVISERLSQSKTLVLNKVFKECQSIPEMITLFLATLELIKVHEVEVEQKENFGDIVLRSVS